MYTEENNNGIYIEKKVRFPAFTMTYEHMHEYVEIFFLKSGTCNYSINGQRFQISAGDLFIVSPGDYHCTSYEGNVPCERLVLYFLPSLIPDSFYEAHPELKDFMKRSGKVILGNEGKSQLNQIAERMLEENDVPADYSCEIMILETMIMLLCIQRNGIFIYDTLTSEAGFSNDIEKALKYIALNYASAFTLEDVANECCLSPTYLSKKFKKITGKTFKEYVTFIRIRQACQMLLTTEDSITTVAMNCGFNSSNYFKDCFKRIYNTSPKTYRKENKLQGFEIDTREES